jgi:hypothetical protein
MAKQKTEIIIKEDGTRVYKKVCPLCRKTFECTKPSQVYCCEQHKEAYAKRRKSKAKSGKRYTKKHNVERAMAGASRQLARRLASLCLPAVDFLTGEEMSLDLLQCHHINGIYLDNSPWNLVFLSAESHSKVHQLIKEKFDCDLDKLFEFGRGIENYETAPEETYDNIMNLRKEIVKFQLSLFKYRRNIPTPEFNEEI